MRKQRSTCTLPSYETLSDWQTAGSSCVYENQPFPGYFWPQFVPFDYPIQDPYLDVLQYGQGAAGDATSQSMFPQIDDGSFYAAPPYCPWGLTGPYSVPDQSFGDAYDLTLPDSEIDQYQADDPMQQQQVLQYGVPCVTDYGAVTLLLRHLIRVDLTPEGALCVYNFPAASVSALNAAGNKSYVRHPNGRVFQEGPTVNMVTGNDRLAKISPRGVTFSSATSALAYFTDESGTKTTTGKFADLSRDWTMDVFYDGNNRSFEELERDCRVVASERKYQVSMDGSEEWTFGRVHVKQDRWGEVTVSQIDCRRTVVTSPTIRKVSVDSPAVTISIDCFSKNYFSVRKDTCLVSSGFCGLIVQKKSQKAGLDRSGRLVLF